MQVRLGHPVHVEAQVSAREKLRVAGWQKVRGEQQDRRWRQWRTAAGGRAARAREEKEQGGFYRLGACRGSCSVASCPTGARGWARRRWLLAAEPAANGAWRFARRRVRTGRMAPA
jgi:hypothetical protein